MVRRGQGRGARKVPGLVKLKAGAGPDPISQCMAYQLADLRLGKRWLAIAIAALAIFAAAFGLGRFTAPIQDSAGTADFIFTDAMLTSLESYQELDLGPTRTVVCLGGSLAIANGSSATVGLTDVPAESDNLVHVGIIKPGDVVRFRPTLLPGAYYVGVVDREGLLLRYDVVAC